MPQQRTLREGKAYNGIVFAVIGRVVEQLNGLTNLVRKCHHPLEKLGADAAAL
jgi:hypothetical protein